MTPQEAVLLTDMEKIKEITEKIKLRKLNINKNLMIMKLEHKFD
jgi:hypothetical protein